MDLRLFGFFVKASPASEKRRRDDGEEAGMPRTRDVMYMERGLGDEKLPSPGFTGVKKRVPG